MLLEALHGFKVGAYLDVSNETRRLLWTLAHAHGALLAPVHIAFAATLAISAQIGGPSLALASRCLLAVLILMPIGFFLGGAFIRDGDPGLGVLLVPPGGFVLLIGVGLVARERAVNASDVLPRDVP